MKIVVGLFLVFFSHLLILNGVEGNNSVAEYCIQRNSCAKLVEVGMESVSYGTICFSTSKTNSSMETAIVKLNGGWSLDFVYLWIGRNIATSPRTYAGNPIVSRYPFSCPNLQKEPILTCAMDFSIPEVFGIDVIEKNPQSACNSPLNFAIHIGIRNGRNMVIIKNIWSEGDLFPIERTNTKIEAKYGTLMINCDSNCYSTK